MTPLVILGYSAECKITRTVIRSDLDAFELEALLLQRARLLRHCHLHLFELGMILVQMKLEIGRSLCTLYCFTLVHLLSLLAQTAAVTPVILML